MKTETKRNTALALVGLTGLSIYILACTSFSPDDSKVLYPTLDVPSGGIGIAVYDRETGVSDLAFLPMVTNHSNTNRLVPPKVMRSQWMADGQRILIACSGSQDSDGLILAVKPWNAPHAPLRLFDLPEIEGWDMSRPLCVAGDRVFLMESKQQILRLDLKTGEMARHPLEAGESEFSLLPVPNDSGVFYMAKQTNGPGMVFGRLNPDNFALGPLSTITNEMAGDSFFAYDAAGKRCAFLEKADPLPQVIVLEDGKPVFRRSLGTNSDEFTFANAEFSKRGDSLLAGFQRERHEQPRVTYGLMEIPLNDQPVREKVLISSDRSPDDAGPFYFQFGFSHDGKTAAVASTYLACMKDGEFIKPGDCALFFIDLSDSNWKVTTVPIALPAHLPDLDR
jgi:hypothetical protein